jgi:hypothetical protein
MEFAAAAYTAATIFLVLGVAAGRRIGAARTRGRLPWSIAAERGRRLVRATGLLAWLVVLVAAEGVVPPPILVAAFPLAALAAEILARNLGSAEAVAPEIERLCALGLVVCAGVAVLAAWPGEAAAATLGLGGLQLALALLVLGLLFAGERFAGRPPPTRLTWRPRSASGPPPRSAAPGSRPPSDRRRPSPPRPAAASARHPARPAPAGCRARH